MEQEPSEERPREDERAELLRKFRGPELVAVDLEVVAFWRKQSAAEHGRMMAELSNYATRLSEQTGHVRDPKEPLPRFPPMLHRPEADPGGDRS